MAVLEAECRRTGRILTNVPIRQVVFRERIPKEELVGQLVTHYKQHDCDGLFLSTVTYQGVRIILKNQRRNPNANPIATQKRPQNQRGHKTRTRVDLT
jgi:hypothetical protein